MKSSPKQLKKNQTGNNHMLQYSHAEDINIIKEKTMGRTQGTDASKDNRNYAK